MKTAVISGGGLAGLFSAKLLVKKGFKVKIIDNSKKLGGLISSIKIKNYYFDHGSHIAQETTNKEVNKILFVNEKKNFYSYKFLPQDHYFNNRYYRNSPFLNINLLEKKKYLKAFSQILKNSSLSSLKFKNEKQRCELIYGKDLTNEIFEPLLKKKTGFKLSSLPPHSKEKFNLSKIIAGDNKITDKLKKNSHYNEILAFNSYRKGVTGRKNLYPKKKGINNLVDLFLTKSFLSKVSIMLDEKIDSIKIKNDKIENIKTNKKNIKADLFIWTGNIITLNSLIYKKKQITNNKKFYWNFYHYLSNKLLKKKIFYSYIYDKDSPIHRVTFYDNFQKKNDKKKKFRFTVEYISPEKKLDPNLINNEIISYLKKIKIIKDTSKVKLVQNYNVPISLNSKKTNLDKNISKLKNLMICGQASGEFSKQKIVLDIYDKISKI